jgi:hypothetical protein
MRYEKDYHEKMQLEGIEEEFGKNKLNKFRAVN